MEKAEGSSPSSSTYTIVEAAPLAKAYLSNWQAVADSIGSVLAGFVAGEGSFDVTRTLPDRRDGSTRKRFRFQISVASWDRPLLSALQIVLGGHGSIQVYPPAKARWQPRAVYSISSRYRIRAVVIPFFDRFLLSSAKYDQFERWRDDFTQYELEHPTQWGRGPSLCSEPGCNGPVRGRGLCRSHYYRATGY